MTMIFQHGLKKKIQRPVPKFGFIAHASFWTKVVMFVLVAVPIAATVIGIVYNH